MFKPKYTITHFILNITQRSARRYLVELVKLKLLIREGDRKDVYYKLNI
ncbi:MAG: hypothetical protein U9Q27_03245 [Patescibacteria group bacterium]|nr:hypothetical protein [Patescibacteria group bacterium]